MVNTGVEPATLALISEDISTTYDVVRLDDRMMLVTVTLTL